MGNHEKEMATMKRPYTWEQISKYFPKGWNYEKAFRKTAEACIQKGYMKLGKKYDKTK